MAQAQIEAKQNEVMRALNGVPLGHAIDVLGGALCEVLLAVAAKGVDPIQILLETQVRAYQTLRTQRAQQLEQELTGNSSGLVVPEPAKVILPS